MLAALYDPFILIVTDDNATITLRLVEMIGLAMAERGTVQISHSPSSIAMGKLNGNLCGLFASGDKLSILNFNKRISVSDFDKILNDRTSGEACLNEEILNNAIIYHMDSSHQCKSLRTLSNFKKNIEGALTTTQLKICPQ